MLYFFNASYKVIFFRRNRQINDDQYQVCMKHIYDIPLQLMTQALVTEEEKQKAGDEVSHFFQSGCLVLFLCRRLRMSSLIKLK